MRSTNLLLLPVAIAMPLAMERVNWLASSTPIKIIDWDKLLDCNKRCELHKSLDWNKRSAPSKEVEWHKRLLTTAGDLMWLRKTLVNVPREGLARLQKPDTISPIKTRDVDEGEKEWAKKDNDWHAIAEDGTDWLKFRDAVVEEKNSQEGKKKTEREREDDGRSWMRKEEGQTWGKRNVEKQEGDVIWEKRKGEKSEMNWPWGKRFN